VTRPGPKRLTTLLIALLASPPVPAADTPPDIATFVHVLNRLTFGPRLKDLDRIRTLGLDRWLDDQLHPERIPDPAVAAHLATIPTAGRSAADLMANYDLPPAAKREIQQKRAEMANASEEEKQEARREFVAKYRGQMEGNPREVLDELSEAKLMRAIYSERQLDEVMVDFWMNHFNVYAKKGPDRFMIADYEAQTIRPHVWGKFEDLLHATAQSPAMLFYLDNWLSADPNATPARRRAGGFGFRQPMAPGTGQAQGQGPRKRGLNENYAREIMELHTLGVDGGYTQKDVTEVARCFTGWTIRGIRQQNPQFVFVNAIHDKGDKVVLGHRIASRGQAEGDEVVHLLATQPATARFIATKLARRLVADDPPPALVDRVAATFTRTGGDIRELVRTVVTSPEFLAPQARAAKIKSPFDFVASAVRATDAKVYGAGDLAARVAAMGMPLYQQQPPTGYRDSAETWVSTAGLLARLNFALDLAGGRVRGVEVDPQLTTRPTGALEARLLPAGITDATRRTLDTEAQGGADGARMAGLILGSPEFQRR